MQTAGFFFQLLPFIEQDNRFKSIDYDPTLCIPAAHTFAYAPNSCIDIGNDIYNTQSWASKSPFPAGSYQSSVQNNPPTWGSAPPGGPATQYGGLKVYYCPSRRPADPHGGWRWQKNDYAAVVPPHLPLDPTHSPEDEFWGDNGVFYGVISPGNNGWNAGYTQFYPATTIASITDGTSNTMAIAEKFLPTWGYESGQNGDDKGAFHGFDNDTFRSTVNNLAYNNLSQIYHSGATTTVPGNPAPLRGNPMQDYNVPMIQYQDTGYWNCGFQFGSSHPSGINAVFADGSVHHLAYSIDNNIFNMLGHRSDHGVFTLDLP
jgi:prepilin-type processing-associated H-X9-DG protein